jgi:putative FmdB family regulatory protein
MPLYEYECDACKQRFEVIQKKFSDPAPETCARCGKGPLHRLMSTPAIQFKGSGWYITDYAGGRSSAASSSSASDGEAKPAGNAEGDKKSGGESSAPKADSSAPPTAPKPAPSSSKESSKE